MISLFIDPNSQFSCGVTLIYLKTPVCVWNCTRKKKKKKEMN